MADPHKPTERELCVEAEILLREPLHRKVRELVNYWLSIHPARGLPGRQHLDPLHIPSLLPNIWLVDVERTPALRLRYRLIGTSVARAFDHDPTGEYLDQAHPQSRDGQIHIYMHDVIRSRLPAWRVGAPQLWQLQDYLQLERIYLPLAADGEQVDLILALTVFLDRHGFEF
ncbi:MAG TPA: PAS domain-containing protein [Thalassobaculum sp.]